MEKQPLRYRAPYSSATRMLRYKFPVLKMLRQTEKKKRQATQTERTPPQGAG